MQNLTTPNWAAELCIVYAFVLACRDNHTGLRDIIRDIASDLPPQVDYLELCCDMYFYIVCIFGVSAGVSALIGVAVINPICLAYTVSAITYCHFRGLVSF